MNSPFPLKPPTGRLVVESVKRTVYLGAHGAEFDNEEDARWSHVKDRLLNLLEDLGGDCRDFDLTATAEGLRENKALVISWLSQV